MQLKREVIHFAYHTKAMGKIDWFQSTITSCKFKKTECLLLSACLLIVCEPLQHRHLCSHQHPLSREPHFGTAPTFSQTSFVLHSLASSSVHVSSPRVSLLLLIKLECMQRQVPGSWTIMPLECICSLRQVGVSSYHWWAWLSAF